MIKLNDYLKNNITIDGHIHFFNWKEPIDLSASPYQIKIGFMDIEYDHVKRYKDSVSIYKDFIDHYYDKNKHILLSTGVTSEDIINIYNNFPDVIKGFGEIKCYDKYQDKEIPYKKVKIIRDICKFSEKHGNLPVYIHYGLNESQDVTRINNILKDYPHTPIVLCHCGMDGDDDFAYNNMVNLMHIHPNLWTDITYKSLTYFFNNPMLLLNLPKDRLFLGTDLNNKNWGHYHIPELEIPDILNKINKLKQYISSDNNIKHLFKIKENQ